MASTSETVWALTRQGETQLQVGNYESAVRYFTEAIEKQPSAWLYAHRGEAFRLSESFNDAIDDFTRAIKLSGGDKSNYAWAYAHLGETRRVMGNKPQARHDFSQAIEIDSHYAWAYAHRGGSHDLYNPEELQPALEDFTKAIELYNKYAWAYAFRSAVYLMMGEGDRAYYDLLHAISLDNTIVQDPIATQLKSVLIQRMAGSELNPV